jgi:hypothetical protein
MHPTHTCLIKMLIKNDGALGKSAYEQRALKAINAGLSILEPFINSKTIYIKTRYPIEMTIKKYIGSRTGTIRNAMMRRHHMPMHCHSMAQEAGHEAEDVCTASQYCGRGSLGGKHQVARSSAQDNTLIYGLGGDLGLYREELRRLREFKLDLVNSAMSQLIPRRLVTSLELCYFADSFLRLSPTSLLVGCIYFEKYLSSMAGGQSPALSMIKCYLACCLIAGKYNDDTRIFNEHMACAHGLFARELNFYEAKVLLSLNFDLNVSKSDVARTYQTKQRQVKERQGLHAMVLRILRDNA